MKDKPLGLTSAEVAEATYAILVEEHAHPEDYRGWKIGIPVLDNAIRGMPRKGLVSIGSKAGGGKTAFLIQCLVALGDQKVKYIFNGVEEEVFDACLRAFSASERIQRSLFVDIGVTKDDWPNVSLARDHIASHRGYWNDLINIDDLEGMIEKISPQVVIVDWLQLMRQSQVSYTNKTVAISEITMRLKTIGTKRLVILAAQLNKEGTWLWTEDVERMSTVCIKINAAMDLNEKEDPTRRVFSISKNRRGTIQDMNIGFNGSTGLFYDLNEVTVDINKIVREHLEEPWQNQTS